MGVKNTRSVQNTTVIVHDSPYQSKGHAIIISEEDAAIQGPNHRKRMSSIKVHVGTPSLCLDGWTRTEISFHGFAILYFDNERRSSWIARVFMLWSSMEIVTLSWGRCELK